MSFTAVAHDTARLIEAPITFDSNFGDFQNLTFFLIIQSAKVTQLNNLGDNNKLAWSADGRALTYLVNHDFVPNLWIQPLEGGKAKQLTNFTSQGTDGKQLVVARTTFKSDIVLIGEAR